MNEKDLAYLALLTGCLGFFTLGYVVLYVPVDLSDEDEYVDGIIQRVTQTENGQIIAAQQVGTVSYLYENTQNISVGDRYRFYNPQAISTTSDLQKVEHIRKLVER